MFQKNTRVAKMFIYAWLVIDSSLQTSDLKWLLGFCDWALNWLGQVMDRHWLDSKNFYMNRTRKAC